jgi:drug/metabolite transporter (DMT)-like permease
MAQSFQPLAHFRTIPQPIQAAIFMVGAALLFAALSATIRHLSEGLHTFEVTFFRNFAGLVFMLPWLFRSGLSGLRTGRFMLYTWRSFLSLVSMLCGFTSLTLLPFDKAIALSFTVPLFATAGAAIFLGEDVRARRWTATIIGFIGVLIILHPGVGDANLLSGGGRAALGAGLSLFSALISAVITLIVKDLARTEPSDAIVTYMVLLLTPMSLLPGIPYWQWPPMEIWLWIVIMGAFGSFGHMCFIRAFAKADASAVMPYDYTRMIFAAIIGYFAFDEAPEIWTWIGAAVIASAAIYIARRETIRRQSVATTAAAAAGEPAAPATIVRPESGSAER